MLKNVICSACGACCDDIQIDFNETGMIVGNACKLGNARFQEIVCDRRIREASMRIDGELKKAHWNEALQKSCEILSSARRPLVFMGSDITCETMKAGLLLGESLGGVVDCITSVGDGLTVMGVQEAGGIGATAGQSKIRSDLAIYWGADPMESMPRHMSRYAIYPRGYWTARGRLDRKIITISCCRSKLSNISDWNIQLKENADFELLSALLSLLHGKDPHPSAEEITGLCLSQMRELLKIMKKCNFGVIYLGSGFASSCCKYRNVELAINLVKELNGFTKFVLNSLRSHCNTGGFSQVASSLYGYPFGLDFSRCYPRYNPGEYTAVDLLRERDIDAALLISSGLDSHLPMDCMKYLAEIPTISIDAFHSPMTLISDVVLPGVVDAIECEGTLYRYDDVPLYSECITCSPFEFTESNEHTIMQILEKMS